MNMYLVNVDLLTAWCEICVWHNFVIYGTVCHVVDKGQDMHL